MRVDNVDANAVRNIVHAAKELPGSPLLEVGHVFDGFTVEERIHLPRITALYRVCDAQGSQPIMKVLSREAHADAHKRLAFAHGR